MQEQIPDKDFERLVALAEKTIKKLVDSEEMTSLNKVAQGLKIPVSDLETADFHPFAKEIAHHIADNRTLSEIREADELTIEVVLETWANEETAPEDLPYEVYERLFEDEDYSWAIYTIIKRESILLDTAQTIYRENYLSSIEDDALLDYLQDYLFAEIEELARHYPEAVKEVIKQLAQEQELAYRLESTKQAQAYVARKDLRLTFEMIGELFGYTRQNANSLYHEAKEKLGA